jgi:UDP-glucose 4-epimerase
MIKNKTILLTGGLGYIGSHIAVHLLTCDYTVIIADNLCNSSMEKLDVIKQNVKKQNHDNLHFYTADLLDMSQLEFVFKNHPIDVVIHLAGLKSVGESLAKPMLYYDTNLVSTINLIAVMKIYECRNIIFSSSATVYGTSKSPCVETMEVGRGLTNPYGKTKYIQEEIFRDLYASDKTWNIVLLRYFNPVGQLNLSMKEIPNGIPNNLFPYIVKVYNGELERLNIFGNDYETLDGTGVRDFIHVCDLASGHVKTCEKILNSTELVGLKTYNLGTGRGISVKQLVDAFEKVNKTKISYEYVPRREGDLDVCYADCSLANKELDWKTNYTVEDMVRLV